MSKSVLVIDGDRPFATRMSTALQSRGLDTWICGDGPQALDEARARRPDLILLCVELPSMSGYAVCNRLKRDEQLRSVPVLLTSAEATAETFEQHRKLRTRADDYLLKPFDAAALLQRVAALIELPPAREVAAQEPAFGEEDLKLIDQAFDELASSAGGAGAPADAGALAPATMVGRVDSGPTAPPAAVAEVQRLRRRVAELEAELARLGEALQNANESCRLVSERASAADARAAAAEARSRQGDSLRDRTRHALAAVLQALDEAPVQRAPPAEVSPRRE